MDMKYEVKEEKILNTEVLLELKPKRTRVKASLGADFYHSEMNIFKDMLEVRMGKLIPKDKENAKINKEVFSLLMEAQYNNRMGISNQILIMNNLESLFDQYIEWICSFMSTNVTHEDELFSILKSSVEEFVNSEISMSLDELLLSKLKPENVDDKKSENVEVVKEEKEQKMETKHESEKDKEKVPKEKQSKDVRKYDEKGVLIYHKHDNTEEWYENGNLVHFKYDDGFEQWIDYDEKGNQIHLKNTEGDEQWYDENGDLIRSRNIHTGDEEIFESKQTSKVNEKKEENKQKVEEKVINKDEKSKVIEVNFQMVNDEEKQKILDETAEKIKDSLENNDTSSTELIPLFHQEEVSISKEQITSFVESLNPFNYIKDFISDCSNFFKVNNLKLWKIEAITGNIMIMIHNTNSVLYRMIDEVLFYLFDDELLSTKKDLVYDSLLAITNEDLEVEDFFVNMQTQFDKKDYIKIFANGIKNLTNIKNIVLNYVPELIKATTNNILEPEAQSKICDNTLELINNKTDKTKVLETLINDIRKSSATPEEDLIEIKNLTSEEKETNMTMNPMQIQNQVPQQFMSQQFVNRQPLQPIFTPVSQPSDLYDYEGDDGFIINGKEPREETKFTSMGIVVDDDEDIVDDKNNKDEVEHNTEPDVVEKSENNIVNNNNTDTDNKQTSVSNTNTITSDSDKKESTKNSTKKNTRNKK